MGKAKQEVAVVEPRALAVVSNQVPDYLRGLGNTGTENIGADEVNIPRLKVGQDMNKEVQAGTVSRGDLFLNVSGEVVVEAGVPLPFVVLNYTKEFILWRPQEDGGGGILTRARAVKTPDGTRYRWDDPNTAFPVKVKGVLPVTWTTKEYIDEDGLGEWGSENPADKESRKAATEHHNYIVALPTRDDIVVALSLSKTQTGPAKDFNATLKMGKGPVVSRIYTIETVDDSRDGHDFKNVKLRPNKAALDGASNESNPFYLNAETFGRYEALAESFKGKTINVDLSDGEDAERDDRA